VGGVAVLLIAALGIFLLVKPDDQASGPATPMTSTKKSASERSSTPRTRTTTAEPTDSPDSFGATLMALIPPGYPTSVCEVASPPAPGALATVDCGLSTQPGGPHAARYSLFADVDQLAQHFADSVAANEEIFRCPGSDMDSPTDWNYKREPDVVAGQVACGTFQGNADVVWTQTEELVLADVQGPDMGELHDWWLNYS
jgi:serine/threonine-protein kinase